MLMTLGHPDGLRPALSLLESGLLFPDFPPPADGAARSRRSKLKSFEQWLAFPGTTAVPVFAHPRAAERALGGPLPFPDTPAAVREALPVQEADGLDWPLRLGVLWQLLAKSPLRRTQQGDFFKRDGERIASDPLLNPPSPEGFPTPPDAGFLAVAFAESCGTAVPYQGELRAGGLPGWWDDGRAPVLSSFWRQLPRLQTWNVLEGWRGGEAVGNPFPSAMLLLLALLAQYPEDAWLPPDDLSEWVQSRHP